MYQPRLKQQKLSLGAVFLLMKLNVPKKPMQVTHIFLPATTELKPSFKKKQTNEQDQTKHVAI